MTPGFCGHSKSFNNLFIILYLILPSPTGNLTPIQPKGKLDDFHNAVIFENKEGFFH